MAEDTARRRTGARTVVAILAIATGLIALAGGLRTFHTRLLINHLRSRVQTGPEEQAAPVLFQLARLGQPAIPALVEALDSPRASVSKAAKRVLLDQLSRWELLPARQSTPRLAALAEALAQTTHHFGQSARRDASDLATRILLWPPDREAAGRSGVVSLCQQVLEATSRFGPQPAPAAKPVGLFVQETEPSWSAAESSAMGARPWQTDVPRSQSALRDLGGLAEPGRVSKLPSWDPGKAPSDQPHRDPVGDGGDSVSFGESAEGWVPDQPLTIVGEAGEGRSTNADSELEEMGPLDLRADLSKAWQLDPRESSEPRKGPSRPNGPRENEPTESGPRITWDADPQAGIVTADADGDRPTFAGSDTLDVMQCLHREDPLMVRAAREELVRRGFSEVHLALARDLFDPDPYVRRRMAQILPNLRSVDPSPWLEQLTRDLDSRVRREALAVRARIGVSGSQHATRPTWPGAPRRR